MVLYRPTVTKSLLRLTTAGVFLTFGRLILAATVTQPNVIHRLHGETTV